MNHRFRIAIACVPIACMIALALWGYLSGRVSNDVVIQSFTVSAAVAVPLALVGALARVSRRRKPKPAHRDWQAHSGTWQGVAAMLLRLMGWPLLLLPFVCQRTLDYEYRTSILGTIAGACMLLSASLLHDRYRRHLIVPLSTHADLKDFVLYLRPFAIDGMAEFAAPGQFETEEESLLAALEPIGPAIAPGRPDEELPELGATRIYFPETEWKARIGELISRAKLCVVVVGATPAVMWELTECIARLEPRRLLLRLPAKRDEFIKTCEHLTRVLPHRISNARPDPGAFVVFDDDWQPRLLSRKNAPLRYLVFSGGKRARDKLMTIVLAPVFEALGVFVARPAVMSPGFRTALAVLASFMALLFLLAVGSRW